MKNSLAVIIVVIAFMQAFTQTPQAFKYQAVARDSTGNVIVNQSVSFKLSIIEDSITGTTVYNEVHNVFTNQFGVVSLEIGNGNVNSGVFADINWANGISFLQIELDETGGTDYVLMGTTQLISVPYALEAEEAAHARSLSLTGLNGREYEVTLDENENMVVSIIWLCGDTLTDHRDNQKYSTVQIGNQCWMGENINIGTKIESGNNMEDNDTIQKYCIDNMESNCDIWGGLYQWAEIMEYDTIPGLKGICPMHWHLPSDEEWKILEGTVDSQYGVGDSIWDSIGDRGLNAGGMLKETGTMHWVFPNTEATNAYDYTALPAGARNTNGTFPGLTIYGRFWTSSGSNNVAYRRELSALKADIYRGLVDKLLGLSVRCIKD